MKQTRIFAALACLALVLALAPAAFAGPSPSVGNCYCDCLYDYWCYANGCGGWQLCQDFTANHCWDDPIFAASTPDDLESFLHTLEAEDIAPVAEEPTFQLAE